MPKPSPTPVASPNRRSWRFLLVFALAYAGGTMGYLPLVAFLLPIKVAAIAGDARIGLFTATALCGTVSAILANLLFGWLSDRSVAEGGGRRGWMVGGVLATAGAYGLVLVANTPVTLVVAVVIFQGAVNAILAPMLAIMADEIPDTQKGLVGGLLAFAYPLAAGLATVVVGMARHGEAAQLAVIVLAVAICVAPLVLTPAQPAPAPTEPPPPRSLTQHDLRIAWLARLLLQAAGNSLTLYLLYYFQSLEPNTPPLVLAGYAGHMLTLAYILPLPFAILIGRLSDQLGRRKPFLLGSAVLTAGCAEEFVARYGPQKEEKEKTMGERRKKEAEEKGRLLVEWMNKKQSNEQTRRQAEQAKQQELEAAQRAQRQEFMKKAQARLTQIIQQKTMAHQQESVRVQEAVKHEESKKETDKKKATELLELERQRREAEKQMKRDFAELSESREIGAVVGEFGRAVATLHDNYAKVGAKEPRNAQLLQWAGLNKFCLHFFLLPEIVSAEELTVLYRMYTKDKTCEDRSAIGMSVSEFADCIVRIAALGQNRLRNSTGEAYEFGLADCNADTVRALFSYMQLPEEPKRVLDLLKDINTQPPLHPRDRKRISKGKLHAERLASLHTH